MGDTVQVAYTKFTSARTFVKSESLLSGRRELRPNVVFFAWTLLHNRTLTADNLQKRDSPICCLFNLS
jgi:hypothetical protein